MRPSGATGQHPEAGVLLPSTLDDFSDSRSVFGDPIVYAQCEQIPGSGAPMTLHVYRLLSGLAYMLGQSSVQTVLASGTSYRPEASHMDMEDSPFITTGLSGCPYRFTSYSGPAISDLNPAFGLQLYHPLTYWVDQLGEEQAMAAAVNLQRDVGIMLSNLQILLQFVTSLHRMLSEMMSIGMGQVVFPAEEVSDLSPAPRATRAAKYMTAIGMWRPRTGPGDHGPVPASSCNACMTCRYCFPEDRLPPE